MIKRKKNQPVCKRESCNEQICVIQIISLRVKKVKDINDIKKTSEECNNNTNSNKFVTGT